MNEDCRILFALSDATRSTPLARPFTATAFAAQLEEATTAFIRDTVQLRPNDGQVGTPTFHHKKKQDTVEEKRPVR